MSNRHLSLCLLLSLSPLGIAQQALVPEFSYVSHISGISTGYRPATSFGMGTINISVMGGGVGIGDFNNDGWEDIYVVTGGAAGDQLLINNQDGTFTDMAASAGLAQPHMGMGCSVGDFDNNGFLDIFVTSQGPTGTTNTSGKHLLLKNNGNLTFTNVATTAGVNTTSPGDPDGLGSTFADYDRDGDLDLYVSGWIPNSGGNRLFQNDGSGNFTDVTAATGLNDNAIRGFAPRFVDMDGDRWPELTIAADFGTSRYFVNNGGLFTDMTVASGTGLDGNGMGQAIGDFNGDGLFDWYVSSIHTVDPPSINVPGTGNMEYRNMGNHNYVEVSQTSGTNDGGWGWGAVAVDLNNDGMIDLAETNGFKAYNGSSVLEWANEPCFLWLNESAGQFRECAAVTGFDSEGFGRGLVHFDYDKDGDQDLLLALNSGRLTLYRNDCSGDRAHFLRVALDTSTSDTLAPNGIGTKLRLNVGGRELLRMIDSGCSYLSTNELWAHFGLRGAITATSLKIEWSNGRDTYINNPTVDTHMVIRYCPADWNGHDGLTAADLADFTADWNGGTADFNFDGVTDAADLTEFTAAYNGGCP
ncbi:MAG: hypothetical protein ACI841_002101 [Planctomycetota bacterium]|jgi:hypothetical protein